MAIKMFLLLSSWNTADTFFISCFLWLNKVFCTCCWQREALFYSNAFEFSHFHQQAASFLLCLRTSTRRGFSPSFLPSLWSWNLLSAKSSAETPLNTDSIILAVQYRTLSAGFTSGSSPPSFLFYSFPHLPPALLVVCVIFPGLRHSFLAFILFPLSVFMLTRWSKTR